MPVAVQGLRELDRALKAVSAEAQVGLRVELATAAEPVRAGAQIRAMSQIRNMTERWSRMRTGASGRVVYVAPQTRRGRNGSPRPNLAGLLMDRAMQPALDAAQPGIVLAVEQMLDRIALEQFY